MTSCWMEPAQACWVDRAVKGRGGLLRKQDPKVAVSRATRRKAGPEAREGLGPTLPPAPPHHCPTLLLSWSLALFLPAPGPLLSPLWIFLTQEIKAFKCLPFLRDCLLEGVIFVFCSDYKSTQRNLENAKAIKKCLSFPMKIFLPLEIRRGSWSFQNSF